MKGKIKHVNKQKLFVRIVALILCLLMLVSLVVTVGINVNAAYDDSYRDLDLLLTNNMSDNYAADYLRIVRDHSNGRYMNENVVWPYGKKAPITFVLSSALREMDPLVLKKQGVDMTVLHSNLNVQDYEYGTTVGDSTFDLSMVNSKWFNEKGTQYIDSLFNSSMAAKANQNYYTTFQMSRGHLAITPNGVISGAGSYPSLMNGYGVTPGTVRGLDEGDFGYFPDEVSAAIQSGWSRLQTASSILVTDNYNLTGPSAVGVASALFNAGEGNINSWYGIAHSNVYSDLSSAESLYPGAVADNAIAENAAEAINKLTEKLDIIIAYLRQHPSAILQSDYINRSYFQGMSLATVIFGMDGFLTSENKEILLNKRMNSAYLRGAAMAYRILCGDITITEEKMKGLLQRLDTKVGDEIVKEGVYELYSGKSYGDVTAYFFSDSNTFTKRGVEYKVVHAAVEEPTTAMFWAPLGGAGIYYQLLRCAGVSCTFEDALADLDRDYSRKGFLNRDIMTATKRYYSGSEQEQLTSVVFVDDKGNTTNLADVRLCDVNGKVRPPYKVLQYDNSLFNLNYTGANLDSRFAIYTEETANNVSPCRWIELVTSKGISKIMAVRHYTLIKTNSDEDNKYSVRVEKVR